MPVLTIEEIKELVKTDTYSFLRENPHLGDNIILLGLGGSYAYGTNNEDSDIDIRGIALNSKEEILSNKNFEQFLNEETDTTVYSFNKMIKLLVDCNPNTIEILGLRPDQYIYISEIGQELIDNREMFLSKKTIHTFGGYANQQLYKLQQLSSHQMEQKELEKHIFKTIEFMKSSLNTRYKEKTDEEFHVYLSEDGAEILVDINLENYPLDDFCKGWQEILDMIKRYNEAGRRNKRAKEHKKIQKHMMHLVRLYLMCFDILEKHEINTYREKERDMLLEIRNGKYITEDNQVKTEFYEIVNQLEKHLEEIKETTTLPDTPDMEKINAFVKKVNEKVIRKG